MRVWVSFVGLLCLSVSVWGMPYYVAPDILEEVTLNEARLEASPTDNEVLFDLAMSYAYSGQILKGWNTLKKLPEAYSDTVVLTYSLLNKDNPDEWRHLFKLAFGYFFQGEKQQSIETFHRVLTIDPNQVWALAFIALVHGEMGHVDETIVYCKKALKIEPNATAVHFLLGEAYRKKKWYFKALKQWLKVGRLQGESA